MRTKRFIYAAIMATILGLLIMSSATTSEAAGRRQKATATTTQTAKLAVRLAVVGDSITSGHNVTTSFTTLAGVESTGYSGRCVSKRCGLWDPMIGGMDVAIEGAPIYGIPGMQIRPDMVVIEMGVNDILTGSGHRRTIAGLMVLREELIEMGIEPVLSTLVPAGTPLPNYAPVKSKHDKVNAWIRNSGFNYVEFDKALRNRKGALKPAYDSGDGIHPNQAGHAKMAQVLTGFITNQ